MKFCIFTLGCKVNQYESQLLCEQLLQLGLEPTESGADVVIVNTCSVTAASEAKCRKTIRRAIFENPNAEIYITGCAAIRDPDTFAKIPGVSQVVTDKNFFTEKIFTEKVIKNNLPPHKNTISGISSFGTRHRAYVKVQDGCQVGCSYCIIPKVRPILKSRKPDEVIAEIDRLVQNGFSEIVLTGIHLGHYGIDFSNGETQFRLDALVQKITNMPKFLKNQFRLRLSSLEAVEVSDKLIELMLEHPIGICPHLHLSMQSGSDKILKAMKRRWMSTEFKRRCEEIIGKFEQANRKLALSTDIIVGFPGESAHDFEETCNLVESLKFSKVHIFKFSPREGTEAAILPNRVTPKVQQERFQRLNAISTKLRKEFAESFISQKMSVLLETESSGTSEHYLEVRLETPVESSNLGRIVTIEAKSVCGDVLFGIIGNEGRCAL